MGTLETAPPQPRLTLLRQLGISITATVAATLILAGIQNEIALFRPAAAPELTSGGKFAARIEALRVAADAETPALPVAPRMPLLVADAALHSIPLSPSAPEPTSPAGRPTADVVRTKRVAHAEVRHRTAEASLVLPPRRSGSVAATVDAEPLVVMAVQDEPDRIWSTTRSLYRQALWLGGATLDRVNPMNLLR